MRFAIIEEWEWMKMIQDGYYHYGTWKSKAPRLWGIASMDIQGRCHTIYRVNGKLPEYRRGRTDWKHVEWLGLTANESKVQYHGFSTVNVEISFCAKSPQQTDLALCEITEAATKFF